MVHIVFEYKDKYTNGNWNRQECIVSSLNECKELYGLGVDCDYKIISVDGEEENSSNRTRYNPYQRTRSAVYATGNKWAIENFNATH